MSYHMKKARKRTRLFGDLIGTFIYNSQRSNITTAERLCDCSDKPSLLIRASLVGKVAYDSTIYLCDIIQYHRVMANCICNP